MQEPSPISVEAQTSGQSTSGPRSERARVDLSPTDTESGLGRRTSRHDRSFLTYAGYARAWRTIATRDDTPHHTWADAGGPKINIERLGGDFTREITPIRTVPRSPDGVYRSLSRMWATEQLMTATANSAVTDLSGDLLRAAAPWITVQAYYACFSATQALVWILEGQEFEQHAAVRRAFSRVWAPDACAVSPFSASASARPAGANRAIEFRGVPEGADPDRTNPMDYWTRYEAWDVAALSLRTALDRHLDDRYRQKRDSLVTASGDSARKRLTNADKEKIRAKAPPFTILDVLHRFRVAANYRDADVFAIGPVDDQAVRAFIANLLDTTTALLFVTELRIASATKAGSMRSAAEAWLSGGRREAPLDNRLHWLDALRGT